MNKITDIKEIQSIELDILKSFHDFCIKHELSYTLMGGTMLGAIRHKGFIPWDDDIDVSMPRPDYDKFISLYREEINTIYEVSSIENSENHIQHFAKLVDTRTVLYEKNVKDIYYNGINIDIFPSDGFPKHQSIAKKHFNYIARLKKYCIWAAIQVKPQGVIKTSLKYLRNIPFKIIGPSFFAKKMDKEYKKYPFDQAEFVTYSTGYALRTKMKRDEFLDLIDVDFCGFQFKCQSDYESILTNIYGDYMKLPPENERATHHNREVYWK